MIKTEKHDLERAINGQYNTFYESTDNRQISLGYSSVHCSHSQRKDYIISVLFILTHTSAEKFDKMLIFRISFFHAI